MNTQDNFISTKTQTDSFTKRICMTALFAALVCGGTFFAIRLPFGNCNLGDIFVLMSAWCLGPLYGMLAAGIGASLADLLMAYTNYAVATLIIKGLVVIVAYYIFKFFKRFIRNNSFSVIFRVVASLVGECVMVFGYFLYESIILELGMSAVANVPWNCIQAVCGVIGSVLLVTALRKVKTVQILL